MSARDMQTPTPPALDPVTLAVLKGRLEQIVDEMDATLYRSAFNPTIAEAKDACHGIYDPVTGDTLVQGKSGLPIFVGVMSYEFFQVLPQANAYVMTGTGWLAAASNSLLPEANQRPGSHLPPPLTRYCYIPTAAAAA